jgi:hypothetical protein
VYGYTTGVFSSRKLEGATYDSVAFPVHHGERASRPRHIATVRRRFLQEIEGLIVRVLELAREMGLLKLGTAADETLGHPGQVKTVHHLDVVNEAGKIGGDIREGFLVHQVDGLDLQRLDAALGLGIIGWAPFRVIHLDREGCADPHPLTGNA